MRLLILLILTVLSAGGCAHLRHTPPAPELPPDAPDVREILDSLAAPERRLSNLEGSGTIRMRLPGEAGTQRFQTGYVCFQQPDKFFAEGRKVGYVVRVHIDGPRFLLELPSENTFYFGEEGDQFDDIALEVAPSQICRESA